jgi:hypothetical protein
MRISTSQLLIILFLAAYTTIISYYLYLLYEKNNLKNTILIETNQNLRKEFKELTKTINLIREQHPEAVLQPGNEPQTLLPVKNENTAQIPQRPLETNPPIVERKTKRPPAVLVVGGTDGSGTRRVVQLLTNLGVLIVSEDPETYDIHADLFGGWPKVVAPLLEATGSITYDPQTLPPQIRSSTEANLRRLLSQAARDSHRPESKILAVGGALPTPSNVHATDVLYGFKAPVAMTLVPWWQKLNPHFMFLHVLRDGRDIAFSANQVPTSALIHAAILPLSLLPCLPLPSMLRVR